MRSDERGEGLGEIDQRMDAALRSYAEPGKIPEARVALARVMARARAAEPQRQGWSIWSATVTAILAVVALVGIVWLMQGPRRREIAWTPRAPAAVLEIPSQVSPGNSRLVAQSRSVRLKGSAGVRERRTGVTKQQPKLDSFPTPRPLSPEEQALLVFSRRAPPAAKKAVIEDQQHWDDPIIVADLGNRPLAAGSQRDQ